MAPGDSRSRLISLAISERDDCTGRALTTREGALGSAKTELARGERFGVPVIRERIFGQDYAKTPATWRNNFRAPLGFDDRFRRLWEYYLAYCAARFLSGNIDVRQVVFAKAG